MDIKDVGDSTYRLRQILNQSWFRFDYLFNKAELHIKYTAAKRTMQNILSLNDLNGPISEDTGGG